jgi:hypothetical protein
VRKLFQTVSELEADRKVLDRIESLTTSTGVIRESIVAMQPSGNSSKAFILLLLVILLLLSYGKKIVSEKNRSHKIKVKIGLKVPLILYISRELTNYWKKKKQTYL